MQKLKYTLLLATISLFISCGGKEEKKEDKSSDIKIGTKEIKKEKNPNEILLTGNDAMKFNLSEITVEGGKEVTLTLKHVGKTSKQIMGHNFVLLKQGTNVQEFANNAIVAGEAKDWIPDPEAVIVNTKMLGGGEETTIKFMPPATGTYDFICSFTGHAALMNGKFIVK